MLDSTGSSTAVGYAFDIQFRIWILKFQSGLHLLMNHLFAVVVIGGLVLGCNSLVTDFSRLELGLGKLVLDFGTVGMVGNSEEVLRSFMSHEDPYYFLLQFQNLLLYSFNLQC